MRITLVFALILICTACVTSRPGEPGIVDRPIIFDEERTQLSLAYMRERYGMEASAPIIKPKMIVVHWTAIPTLEASYQAFYASRLPDTRTGIKGASALNVSVPYLIDRDGTIYRLMEETRFGRHVIGLNHVAIGIENVGDGEQFPLTEEQYQANLQLIRSLIRKYDIEYVIGHHEYQRFIGHELWKEKDPNYLTQKSDPGDDFMNRLRADLTDANLKPLPPLQNESDKQTTFKIEQGIKGKLIWLEGNLMPAIVEEGEEAPPAPEGSPVQREVHIYQLTHRNEADYQEGFFSNIREELVKVVESNEQGIFTVALEPGKYSVFVKEPQGLYASRFDGEGHIQPVKVEENEVTNITIRIDYKAFY